MITIRKGRPDDYNNIAALHTKSWQENYRGNFSDRFLDVEAAFEREVVWKDRLKRPSHNQFVLVAEHHKEICGFACAYMEEDDEYGTLLDNLHVAGSEKGRGIGKRLIMMVAQEVKRTNPNAKMYLWVLENNVRAISFYERLGGVCLETVVGSDIGDREVRKCRMVWNSLEPFGKDDDQIVL